MPHSALNSFRVCAFVVILACILVGLPLSQAQTDVPSIRRKFRVEIAFSSSAHAGPVTGRVFLIVSRKNDTEPRLQLDFDGPELLGTDVHDWVPGQSVVIDDTTPGFPVQSLGEVAPGDYYVQAILNVYTEFHRADGHIVWAHMDQWEGQNVARSPGNLYSEVQKIHLGTKGNAEFRLPLSKVIPSITPPPDTGWVKHIKFESKLLTQFWGHAIYLGATVLLPKGYDSQPAVHYPVIYLQGHFALGAPFSFTTRPDKPRYESWARQRAESKAKHVNMEEPPDFQSDDEEDDGSMANPESGYEFFESWNSNKFP